MFWFWIPLLVLAGVIALAVLGALIAWGRDATDRVEGETVYDAPTTPPARHWV